MKWIGVVLAGALASALSGACQAQGAVKPKAPAVIDAAKQKQILDVLTLAGVHKALEESAAAYEKQLKRGFPEEALQEDGAALSKSVRDSLAPNKLAFFITREVAASMSGQEIDVLSKWYGSPTGRKVVDARVRGLPLMRDEAALMKGGKEEERQMSMNRISLIGELLKASREGQVMADMAVAVGTATLKRMNESTAKPEMLAFFMKTIEDQRPAMVTRFDGVARSRIAVTMKSVTDDEMRALVKFEGSPEQQKFSAAVAKGTEVGVLDALDRLIDVSKRYEEKRRMGKT
jgi:hypothetical protein